MVSWVIADWRVWNRHVNRDITLLSSPLEDENPSFGGPTVLSLPGLWDTSPDQISLFCPMPAALAKVSQQQPYKLWGVMGRSGKLSHTPWVIPVLSCSLSFQLNIFCQSLLSFKVHCYQCNSGFLIRLCVSSWFILTTSEPAGQKHWQMSEPVKF